MRDLPAVITELAEGKAFPARVRVVASGPIPGIETEPAWHGAEAPVLVAAAAGLAVAERERQGAVVCVIRGEDLREGILGPALVLAQRLGSGLILAVADVEEADLAWCAAAGWSTGQGSRGGPIVLRIAGQAPVATPPRPGPMPPVHVPGLSTWLKSSDGIDVLAAHERRVILADRHAPWCEAGSGPLLAVALAAYAGEGHRCVWRAPAGQAWIEVLRQLDGRRVALTILAAPQDLPHLGWWRGRQGWWVIAPGDPAVRRGAFARALAGADATVITTPSTDVGNWPPGVPFEPGSATWLRRPANSRATLIGGGDERSALLGAAESLALVDIEVAILICVSLVPLAEGILRELAAGPVVVAAGVGATADLPESIASLLAGTQVIGVPAHPADLAAAVRARC